MKRIKMCQKNIKIFDKIEYLIIKVRNNNYYDYDKKKKIRVNSMDDFHLEKTLKMHNVVILIRSV